MASKFPLPEDSFHQHPINGINEDFLRLHSADESHSQRRDVSTQTDFKAIEISTRSYLLGPKQEILCVEELEHEFQEREREGVEEAVRLRKQVVRLKKEVARWRRAEVRLREELRFLKQQQQLQSSSSSDETMMGNQLLNALDQPFDPTSGAQMSTSQPGYDNSRGLHNIQGARPKTTSQRSQLRGSTEVYSSSQGPPTGVGKHPFSGSCPDSSISPQSLHRSLVDLPATVVRVEELCIRVAKLLKGDEQAQILCEPHQQHCAVKAPCCGKLLLCQECHEGCGANQNARKLSDEEEKEGETDAVSSGI